MRGCLFYLLEKAVVAFDVRLKKDINLATNGRVVFGIEDLNEGNGYDPSTGIFTAPASGVFVFDWTTFTQYGKYASTALVVNGKFKSWNHCYDGAAKTYLQCSKLTVVKLKKGDQVWIGVFYGTANIYNKYTSFLVINCKQNFQIMCVLSIITLKLESRLVFNFHFISILSIQL